MMIIGNKGNVLPLIRTYSNQFMLGWCYLKMSYNRFIGSSFIIQKKEYSTYTTRTKDIMNRFYSSISYDFYGSWERLRSSIDSVRWKDLYPGSIYASMGFIYPYPRAIDCDVLTLAFIQLLEQYAYNIDSAYLKFTIGYTITFIQ